MKKIFVLLTLTFAMTFASAAPTEKNYNFKSIKIVVTEDPDTITPNSNPPMKSPTWTLKTFKGKKQIDSVEFKNIEAVGGNAGIFEFKSQPFDDYFVFTKDGDYDSRCLIIGKTGKIINHPCLSIYKDSQKYYFIRDSESDGLAGGTIDRKTGKSEEYKGTYPPYSKSLKTFERPENKWVAAKTAEEYAKERAAEDAR